MKKTFSLSLMSLIIFFFLGGVAFAAYGIHGTYIKGADNCGLCHRDHTLGALVASVTNPTTSLLQSNDVQDTCLTCHSTSGTGANTNVNEGIYLLRTPIVEDESTPGAVLNAGGFERVGGPSGNLATSSHAIDEGTYTAWGGGTVGPGTPILMKCTSCHDPHGSSNYRILLDTVNGLDRTGYVQSNETNFPVGGFIRHPEEGTYFYGDYVPDFTTPKYKTATSSVTGISGWCVACHTQYLSFSSFYDAGDAQGLTERFRHAVNRYLGAYKGVQAPLTTDLPLGKATLTTPQSSLANEIQCLTCHRAHGTSATATLRATVAPAFDSTLLRFNNRGVCQNCHKK